MQEQPWTPGSGDIRRWIVNRACRERWNLQFSWLFCNCGQRTRRVELQMWLRLRESGEWEGVVDKEQCLLLGVEGR